MKRACLIGIAFVLLASAGCQAASKSTLVVTPESAASKPDKPTADKPEPQDPRYKPQRIHQLKDLESRKVVVNGHTLSLWLMDDESKREEGMMWLEDKDVKDTEGMLFLFKDSAERGFWMQNCPLGLDICYINPKGKVIHIGEGKPFSEDNVPSKGAAQYVMELKVGRSKKFGIKPGTLVPIPPGAKSKD